MFNTFSVPGAVDAIKMAVDAVHEHGAKIVCQIGNQGASVGHFFMPPPWAPSAVLSPNEKTERYMSHEMTKDEIAEMIEYIQTNAIPVHSMHIVRNGYLVTEAYFYPYDGSTVHDIASVTKSVTSVLVGAAINNGLIKDEFTLVKDFFPEYDDLFSNTSKEQLTIRDLLTMTSGLELVINDSTRSTFGEATLFGMFTLLGAAILWFALRVARQRRI